ncbi:MAG: hypothetical protein AAB316_00560 [Bacteroidota bacterium]
MRNAVLPSCFFFFLLFSQCNSSKTLTGEVNYLTDSELGTVLVSAAGYGASKSQAVSNAETNAFNTLIFNGIPGSQYRLPMVEASEKGKHKTYFYRLLDEQGYKSFLMLSEPQTAFSGGRKNQKNILVKVKINVDGLRRDMEQAQVVRKFGL